MTEVYIILSYSTLFYATHVWLHTTQRFLHTEYKQHDKLGSICGAFYYSEILSADRTCTVSIAVYHIHFTPYTGFRITELQTLKNLVASEKDFSSNLNPITSSPLHLFLPMFRAKVPHFPRDDPQVHTYIHIQYTVKHVCCIHLLAAMTSCFLDIDTM